MIFSDLIPDIRERLGDKNDGINSPRYSDPLLARYLCDGIKLIHTKRPDSQRDSSGDRAFFVDLYEYSESNTNTGKVDNYQNIEGWDKKTYPVLYFKASSSSVINIYPSDADRTAGTNLLAHINNADQIGFRPVIQDNNSGITGALDVINSITGGDIWDTAAYEIEIPLDNVFYLASVHYVCFRAYGKDNEDTYAQNRAAFHDGEFKSQLGIG